MNEAFQAWACTQQEAGDLRQRHSQMVKDLGKQDKAHLTHKSNADNHTVIYNSAYFCSTATATMFVI